MSKIDRAAPAASEALAAGPNRLTWARHAIGPAGLALGLLTAGCAGPAFYSPTAYQTYPYAPRTYPQPYFVSNASRIASAPNMGQTQILSGDSVNVFVPPAKTSSSETPADEPFDEPKALAAPEEVARLPAPSGGAAASEVIEGGAASEAAAATEAVGAAEGVGFWEVIGDILILVPK